MLVAWTFVIDWLVKRMMPLAEKICTSAALSVEHSLYRRISCNNRKRFTSNITKHYFLFPVCHNLGAIPWMLVACTFVIDWLMKRMMPCRENLYFSSTISRNILSTEGFLVNIPKHYFLFPVYRNLGAIPWMLKV